ncbi:40S ribosomal protein S12 [Striga asiatica]|uniref:40S ribosomal protein S12 n=1 Tax=Striga asiatica TaxID=4170 RepID=A0A5A7RCC6_STRAF|nr:40S ribosomal protein S12 [Striga asiatica]
MTVQNEASAFLSSEEFVFSEAVLPLLLGGGCGGVFRRLSNGKGRVAGPMGLPVRLEPFGRFEGSSQGCVGVGVGVGLLGASPSWSWARLGWINIEVEAIEILLQDKYIPCSANGCVMSPKIQRLFDSDAVAHKLQSSSEHEQSRELSKCCMMREAIGIPDALAIRCLWLLRLEAPSIRITKQNVRAFTDKCLCFSHYSEDVAVAEAPAPAPALGEPMDIMTALQLVLKKSRAHSGLARGLHEAAKVIEKHAAQLCVLAEDCDQSDYVKLVKSLCADHNVSLITVPSAKTLGEWVGLCKIDSEGKARKVVGCSCVVVKDYGEDSEGLPIVQETLSKLLRILISCGMSVADGFMYGEWQDIPLNPDLRLVHGTKTCSNPIDQYKNV